MNSETILKVTDLTVCYQETGAQVEKINFQIKRGQVLGLLGESGSGKSTICHAILGLLDRRGIDLKGSICLNGEEILPLHWSGRERLNGKEIGVILQNPMASFNPYMKIKGHFVETLCTHLLCSKRDALLHGLEQLQAVGLSEGKRIMNSYPFQLSGGMLQRVMAAIAVSMNPVLLIADEPTTALDAKNHEVIMKLLAQIMAEYRPALLLVSHDVEVMNRLADQLIILKDGQIREAGAIRDVMNASQDRYTKELLAAAARLEVGKCWK